MPQGLPSLLEDPPGVAAEPPDAAADADADAPLFGVVSRPSSIDTASHAAAGAVRDLSSAASSVGVREHVRAASSLSASGYLASPGAQGSPGEGAGLELREVDPDEADPLAVLGGETQTELARLRGDVDREVEALVALVNDESAGLFAPGGPDAAQSPSRDGARVTFVARDTRDGTAAFTTTTGGAEDDASAAYVAQANRAKAKLKDLRKRLTETKEEANVRIARVLRENRELQVKLRERQLEIELLKADNKAAMEKKEGGGGADDGLEEGDELERLRREEEEKRIARLERRREALRRGVADIDEDYDLALFDENKRRHNVYIIDVLLRAIHFAQINLPLVADLSYVESRYGQGIGSFFAFFRWLFLNGLILSFVWLVILTRHYLDQIQAGVRPEKYIQYSSHGEEDGIRYAIGLMVSLLIITILSLRKLISEDRIKRQVETFEMDDASKKFARLAFNCWDYSLSNKRRVEDQRYSIAQSFLLLLHEQTLQGQLKKRTKQERYALLGRRVVGSSAMFILLITAWTLIIMLTVNKTSIEDRARGTIPDRFIQFVVPASITVINMILPMVIKAVTLFERWDTPATRLKFESWRLFSLRILNIFILLVTYFQLLIPVKDRFLPRIVPELGADECPSDFIGLQLLNLLLADFLLPKLGLLAFVGFWYGHVRIWKRQLMPRPEFEVSRGVVDMIYSQTLTFVAMPFLPTIAIIGAAGAYLSFKFHRVMLVRYLQRPVQPWRPTDTSAHFVIFYMVTFAIFLVTQYYFLVVLVHGCASGPFPAGSTTIEAVRTRVERIDWLQAGINQGFLEPVFLWFLLTYVFTRYYVLGNQLDTVAAYLHDFSGDSQREIVSLRHIIKKQNRKLEAQTEMLEFLIEEEEDDIVEYRRKKKKD